LIRPFFYCGRAIRATSVASSYPSREKREHRGKKKENRRKRKEERGKRKEEREENIGKKKSPQVTP